MKPVNWEKYILFRLCQLLQKIYMQKTELQALPQTNNIKAIITAELPMDLEKKGQQSYQGDLYVRFIGFSVPNQTTRNSKVGYGQL